ncbi:hypothetical protein [Bradyrhizobium yuanmingense]|uniref:hypothetical protein n=2 Tax=Bradyrhizobium yuanmingense TaxID=108015 RepID=UPI0035167729
MNLILGRRVSAVSKDEACAQAGTSQCEGRGGDRSCEGRLRRFSLGGATGLVLMGIKPDFARVASLCKETTGMCAQPHNGETPPEPIQDARIRAAVIVDPAPATLTRDTADGVMLRDTTSDHGASYDLIAIKPDRAPVDLASVLPPARLFVRATWGIPD